MEDDAIVALYWQRNEEALRLSEEKYGSRLRGLALRILADAHDAEECENDTYLAAWNSIPPHEPRSYLFAFLARITRHLSLNCCRDRERLKRSAHLCELSAEMEQCLPAPDDAACRLEENELREAINGFLAKLPEYDAALFTNKKSKTNPEIAAQVLDLAIPALAALPAWTEEAVHDALLGLAQAQGMKNGTLLWPVRIALAGKAVTPGGAIEIAVLLGRDESLKRLKAGRAKV